MSNGNKKKLNLKPAHDALQTLLQDIEAAGEDNLPATRGTTIPLRADWLATLKKTRAALPEWCDGFLLEVQSKR
jgi:hypothetical protein